MFRMPLPRNAIIFCAILCAIFRLLAYVTVPHLARHAVWCMSCNVVVAGGEVVSTSSGLSHSTTSFAKLRGSLLVPFG